MPVNYQLGKIYKIVNTVNNTIYIGSTAQKTLAVRMSCHRSRSNDKSTSLYTAMRSIGADHFRIILHHLFPCNNKDELVAEEYKTLDEIIASGTSVYNHYIGGKADAATRAKNAVAHKGFKHSDAARAKISAGNKGKKRTDEMKANLSEQHFNFGCISLYTNPKGFSAWRFQWNESGTNRCRNFSCTKYGKYAAFFRAEEARREIYSEWGNDEDIYCDDLGHIEW